MLIDAKQTILNAVTDGLKAAGAKDQDATTSAKQNYDAWEAFVKKSMAGSGMNLNDTWHYVLAQATSAAQKSPTPPVVKK